MQIQEQDTVQSVSGRNQGQVGCRDRQIGSAGLEYRRGVQRRKPEQTCRKLHGVGKFDRGGLCRRTDESPRKKLTEAAQRLYRPGPDAAELAAFGLTVDDVADPPLNIFPDNWQSFRVFTAMRTQWRYVSGMAGMFATGLDYRALTEVWERTKTPEKDRDAIFRDLMIMESAAMEIINEVKNGDRR